MKFPKWVLSGSKSFQAENRIRYMLYCAAVEAGSRPSIKFLCTLIGCNHATVAKYVARGSFSEEMAVRFEKKFAIDADHLVNPMDIKVTPR